MGINKNIVILLVIILVCSTSFGQIVRERLILTDTKDSLYLNSEQITFDENGNYCFVINAEGKKYFVTNNDTIGDFTSINSLYGKDGEMCHTNYYSDRKGEEFLYKNRHGIKVYGGAIGKIEDYQTSHTQNFIGIVTSLGDSVYYYVNGSLVSKLPKEPEKYYGLESDWVAFSQNGNSIYYTKQDSLFFLYVNGNVIDSSSYKYTQLAINNRGYYVYAKGNKPNPPIENYYYRFFIHSSDSTLDYVRTVWNYELKENDAYYYSGDNNGPYYIAINNQLYKDIENISNLRIVDQNHYLYSFDIKNKSFINSNGNISSHQFEELLLPNIDREGNYAVYGVKKRQLYKYVNGEVIGNPLSKFGVRATPLYISPTGESVHYYALNDSIYLFKDDSLMFRPICETSFKIELCKEILPNHYVKGKTDNVNSLFHLELNDGNYLVYNGNFSKALCPIKSWSYKKNKEIGQIVAGRLDDNGFFAVQKVDERKYLIIVNNEIYEEMDEIDTLLSNSFFFDGETLIFYGTKGYSFYQFRIDLRD